MGDVLQMTLAQAAIACSVFSLITYLWLGLTVLLLGNRQSAVTWVGGLGLLSGALFFLCHGALVGAGVPADGSPSDFWWRLAWLPAFLAPAFWAAVGVHYAGLTGAWRHLRRPALLCVGGVGVLTALLALVNWPVIAQYGEFIRLLDNAARLNGTVSRQYTSPALPALGIAFVIYISACACLPWASLVARRLRPVVGQRGKASSGEAGLLWDARDAWSQARPALLAASLFMMVAGLVVAIIGVLVLLAEHQAALGAGASGFPLAAPATKPGHVSVALVLADLCVQFALAGVGLTVGWAVVRQGVLVERRLPQRGYLSHWRGTALVAGVLACVVAAMAAVEPESLPNLLLLVALVSVAYALVTWQSYVTHDRLLAQLRPFVGSLAVGHTGWLATDPTEVERSVEALFTSLCRDVLGAAHARLALTAGRLHKTFTYVAPPEIAVDRTDRREWSLPVTDERGVVARLVLGPRADGAGYTSVDLEVARACGQRILDAVGEFGAAQAVASLARRRGLESELSAALPRRVLHDDILPRLHLSMLRLESLRAHLSESSAESSDTGEHALAPGEESAALTRTPAPSLGDDLGAVVRELGAVHHDLAALMRAVPTANPRHLEHGLVSALQAALQGQFRGTFDELVWDAPDDACMAANALPVILADLLLGATLEAVRNAGRHARGGDLHRQLTLRVALAVDEQRVTIQVADNGVGLQSPPTTDEQQTPQETAAHAASALPLETDDSRDDPPSTAGTRTGLLTHGALMALVGGSLTVQSEPGEGTTVTLRVPRARTARADARADAHAARVTTPSIPLQA